MHRILCILTLLLAVSSVRADDAKLNTLTPQEIADGWLLLFDGETTFGWRVDGEAKVENGVLVLGGEKATKAESMPLPTWRCSFDFEARWEGKERLGFEERPGFRVPDMLDGRLTDNFKAKFVRQYAHHTKPPTMPHPPAPQPVSFEVPAGTRLFLRNVKVRPVGLEPIFNGKDLSGWKVFSEPPRNKSVFTVADAMIHLKNGPGDLQTEKQWADFVLQIECKTNGERLNSGVFFRCRPGEYQNGYEAQIHNAFLPEPTKEYTLDVFDPATHELKEKKKEKYAAVDFGTGAIYRRQPARKQMAKDFEWFTMTVVARERQLCVWVNGVLVTDWTDHRPGADNARNGYRAAAGAISLQGHDKTTDLSFRNIRVTELPRK